MIDDQSKSFLQMHCKDTTVELDVDPEDPEVLIMTCLVSIDHNIDDGDNDIAREPKIVLGELLYQVASAVISKQHNCPPPTRWIRFWS